MIKLFKSLIIIIFFSTITLQANSETSWIKKKSDKSKTEIKLEKKQKKATLKKKSDWIKKKKKQIKKKFKKEEKKITKEVKSWLTKKEKDKYINNINNLPEFSTIYFVAKSDSGKLLYGYVNADPKSKKIENYYETSKGKGYINDGKTICRVASTVLKVTGGNATGNVSGNCSDGTKFSGSFSQNMNSGHGSAGTKNSGEIFFFNFNSDLKIASNIIKKFDKKLLGAPTTDNIINPEGKYYALIIANSNYKHNEVWSNLKSPVKDGEEIKKILKNKYKFKNVWLIKNATRDKIFEEIDKLDKGKILTDKDYLLIYYAGHGQRRNNKAYWVGVNSNSQNKYFQHVNVNELTNSLESIKARHIFFMIDSCYAGISFNNKSSTIDDVDNSTNAIKKSLINYSRKVLTSGHNQKVIDTYFEKDHSLFAEGFLKILKENNTSFTAETLYVKIKKLHQMDASLNQVPKYGPIPNVKLNLKDIAIGDFVFHVPNN
jgi:hypothetical protein